MRRLRRLLAALVVVAGLAIALAVGVVAGRRAVQTTPAAPAKPQPTTYTVVAGELVDSSRMNVQFRWDALSEFRNHLVGTVTRTSAAPNGRVTIESGQILYRVNEVPVAVMAGEVPAYRELHPGLQGDDVSQLQTFLVTLGVYDDAVDGRWRSTTTAGVRKWQAAAGLPRSDSLPFGSILFVPTLPLDVGWTDQIVVGTSVVDGAIVFKGLPALPTAQLMLPPDFTRDLRTSTVESSIDDATIELTADSSFVSDETGQSLAGLRYAQANVACASWCDSIAVDKPLVVPSSVTFAGPFRGSIVPVGVLTSDANQAFVTMRNGTRRNIDIVMEVNGEAIVKGVDPGDVLVVPTDAHA